MMNKETETKSAISIKIARLCTDRFDKDELRSESVAIRDAGLTDAHPSDVLRGRWNNRVEFLLSCIGFAVGLGNVWRFPIKVYKGGGGAFLIPYTIICLLMGAPLLMMELGLGQFSSRSPVNVFKLTPVFYGLGWSMMILVTTIEIYYGVVIAYSYIYLFGSFRRTMAWTTCSHHFNTIKCLPTSVDMKSINRSLSYVSSTSEFWDYYVTGFYKSPSNVPYSMNEFPGAPIWHLTLCLLLVWTCNALALMFGVQVSGRVIYITVIFPYVGLLALIILGCTLPGGLNGIKYYLRPDWGKMIDPETLRGAVEQLFFSSCIGLGGMITYASYNGFNDNFYRDALLVIAIDFLTSVLAGFAVFPILGYMSLRNNVPIEKVITSGTGLFFITYPEALGTLRWGNLWTMILMLMAVCLGLDSQFADIECISTGIMDLFPVIRANKQRKAAFISVVCFLFFIGGLLLCTPGGTYYFDILDVRVSAYGLPLLAMLESIIVGHTYGMKQFRYDFSLMTGFNLNWYWFITMSIVCPVIIIVIIIASIVLFQRIIIADEPVPVWGEVLSFFILVVALSPLFGCALHTIVTYRRKYPHLTGKEFIKKLINPPVYWGPFHKVNWLKGKFYREKLLTYKEDPRFLKYVMDTEDLPKIIALAEAMTEKEENIIL